LTAQFRKIAHRYQRRYEAIEALLAASTGSPDSRKEREKLIFRAQFFHFMGEVEAVFGIRLIPLFVAIIGFHGWSAMVDYVGQVNVADAIFVVAIMAIASSLPILRFTEILIAKVSAIGRETPASWWLTILTLGPLLGSFITGPAAMTICAILLRHRFYSLKPSRLLKYATLGLLFVNISVGGVLTQFASPPVVVVANVWNLKLVYMLAHFGWKAVAGIVLSNLLYLILFRREFSQCSRGGTRSRRTPANSVGHNWYTYPLPLLDSGDRPLSRACNLGSSFLSCVRLSHTTEPAADCAAAAITRWIFPCSPNHSRRLSAMVDCTCSRQLK
jgi:putative Na+/H+ antiporter